MTNLVGFYSACELVRFNTPFEMAVDALVNELDIGRDDAVAAMHAAHERADWGLDQVVANSAAN